MTLPLSRRSFLTRSSLLGCCAAASPLMTPLSFAAAPWDARLVVIILRGGMDGLDVVQPWGAAEYADLRGKLGSATGGGPAKGAHDLDGFFAMHQSLAPLIPLWQQGELGFVHAVATPYRHKRSHFDGQDLLEAGTPNLSGVRDGWLNRMLQSLPGVEGRTAYAIGHGDLKVLTGSAPVSDWSPDSNLDMSPQAVLLAQLVMEQDPAFHAALSEALNLSDDEYGADGKDGTMAVPRKARGRTHIKIAEFTAEQLRGDTRVASFSINGWDTHNRQERSIRGALSGLAETILTLKQELGSNVWNKTSIVAMTEFGRTVRLNGTGGTDHGTGGAMILAGGAVRGGRVLGRWPGLDEAALFERRDLMPTGDVRSPAAWMMRAMTGLNRDVLERVVFPGLDMGADPGIAR
jgi:uncharacterized protein (DUF1501 family)